MFVLLCIDLIVFTFRVQTPTPQSHPHVQNPASAHHQVKKFCDSTILCTTYYSVYPAQIKVTRTSFANKQNKHLNAKLIKNGHIFIVCVIWKYSFAVQSFHLLKICTEFCWVAVFEVVTMLTGLVLS